MSVGFGTLRKTQGGTRDTLIPDSSWKARPTTPTPSLRLQAYPPTRLSWPQQSHGPPMRGTMIFLVGITLKPGAPLGEFKGKVMIETNHPKDPKIEVPVTATIIGDIDVFPDTLFLGLVKKGQGAEKTIKVSTVGKEPLNIEKVDNALEHVSVKLRPVG